MNDYRYDPGNGFHALSYRQVMDIVDLVRPYTPEDFADNIRWCRDQLGVLQLAFGDTDKFLWFVAQLHQLYLD